jgi:hypothetical protein
MTRPLEREKERERGLTRTNEEAATNVVVEEG